MKMSGCLLCGKELSNRNASGYCRSCFWKSPDNRLEWGFSYDSVAAGRNQAARLFPIDDDLECERCESLATERHHIDGNTLNNEKSNISFLCKPCHTRETNRKNWEDPVLRKRLTIARQQPRRSRKPKV